MHNLFIASQQSDLAAGFVVLASLIALVICVACGSGSGQGDFDVGDKPSGGFRPIGPDSGDEERSGSDRSSGFKRASRTQTGIQGRASKRAVDWITGEKIDD